MRHIGIDPGASGALAVVGKNLCNVLDIPLIKSGQLKKKVDADEVEEMLEALSDGEKCTVIMEEQGVQGAQTGRVAAFSMGMNYSMLLKGVLNFCIKSGSPLIMVKPQQWKKTLGLLGSKGMSQKDKKKLTIGFVKEVFPDAEIAGPKGGIKDGRADALAIAEYGRRKY